MPKPLGTDISLADVIKSQKERAKKIKARDLTPIDEEPMPNPLGTDISLADVIKNQKERAKKIEARNLTPIGKEPSSADQLFRRGARPRPAGISAKFVTGNGVALVPRSKVAPPGLSSPLASIYAKFDSGNRISLAHTSGVASPCRRPTTNSRLPRKELKVKLSSSDGAAPKLHRTHRSKASVTKSPKKREKKIKARDLAAIGEEPSGSSADQPSRGANVGLGPLPAGIPAKFVAGNRISLVPRPEVTSPEGGEPARSKAKKKTTICWSLDDVRYPGESDESMTKRLEARKAKYGPHTPVLLEERSQKSPINPCVPKSVKKVTNNGQAELSGKPASVNLSPPLDLSKEIYVDIFKGKLFNKHFDKKTNPPPSTVLHILPEEYEAISKVF